MYVWHTAPIEKLGDLTTKEMIVGAQAPGSTQYDYPKLAEKLFGWKFKVITGYEATPKIHLAMERGEVHGTWANWSTLKAISEQWIKEKKIRILAQWALRKHPELPDVPLILEQAKTEEQKQSLDLALARLEFGRPFFMPPNVPAERVNAIRRAFDATMKDKEFLDEADKLKIEIDPLIRRAGRRADRADLQDAGRDRGARARRHGAEVDCERAHLRSSSCASDARAGRTSTDELDFAARTRVSPRASSPE